MLGVFDVALDAFEWEPVPQVDPQGAAGQRVVDIERPVVEDVDLGPQRR